jgi:hypothetical protein
MSSKKKACPSGKVKYPTERAARKTAKFFNNRGPSSNYGRPYMCKHCGKWHNTSRQHLI